MTRTTRSPLHRASRTDISALRELITARLAWERALGTPNQFLYAGEPLSALMRLPFATVERIRDRSRGRWALMPHFEESLAVYRDQHLQRHDRAAWEQKKLRTAVEKLRTDVAEMKATFG